MPHLDLALIVLVQAALLAAVVILREPKLLIPAVVIGLPVEYLQTQTVDTLGEGGIGGAIRAMLNPGKAAMAATVVIALWRARYEPRRLLPRSGVLLPALVILFLSVVGLAWSDLQRPNNAVLILVLYVAFVFAAPSLIEDRRDLERVLAAFFLAAIALSLLAVAQRLLGIFQWRTALIQSDAYSYRANATFADPNNLARYLAITMALAAASLLALGPRRLTAYLAVPALLLSAPALIATASRSGWLGMLVASFIVVLLAPVPRSTKTRINVAAFGTLGALLSLLLIQGGADAERVRSLAGGADAVLGVRQFLIRGGWEMWKDNPLVGVGTGGYQNALLIVYNYVMPYWAKTSLSHTSFISILAEWGLVGVAAFAFFAARLGAACVRIYRSAGDPFERMLGGWLIAAFVEILFQSQSEGRLFEEPYLWLLIALVAALEAGAARRAPASVPAAADAPAASAPAPPREPSPAPAPA
ncbi:MAG: O-antigen ligase family protein [Dehalococcoidia bacterium]|nr:O-antigen ligase family protein [Dehalococcoidia bacterium]